MSKRELSEELQSDTELETEVIADD
jgi:hypothetical protein